MTKRAWGRIVCLGLACCMLVAIAVAVPAASLEGDGYVGITPSHVCEPEFNDD